jgi:hypothetical protein
LVARLHYTSDADVEDIEAFKIGSGISFFLTFIGGGTIAVDLTDVREIRYVGPADCAKGVEAGAPIYRIKVWMDNGRILEGFSADLHNFSGRRSGQEWKFSSTPETSQGRQLSRIVMRGPQRLPRNASGDAG